MEEYRVKSALKLAISVGSLALVEDAHHDGAILDADAVFAAAQLGRVDVLEYLHRNGAPWDPRTTECGHLNCIQFAHEHGCPWGLKTTSAAASLGRLECMQYAHEHGAPWAWDCIRCAARGGSVACLQYSHEHSGGWDQFVAYCASSYGNTECLRYSYEIDRGAYWSTDLVFTAAHFNHLGCLQFLVERGCSFNASDDAGAYRNRSTIAKAMARRRAATVIQQSWRARRNAVRRRAVCLIEDAFIMYSCRPGSGQWFHKAETSFHSHSHSH